MSRESAGVSVVLGGTRGIGAAVAERLAQPGRALILGFLQDRSRANAIRDKLSKQGADVSLVEGNIADSKTLETLRAVVETHGGQCAHLVHSVAVTAFKPMSQVKANQWSLTMDVSARSFLEAVRVLADPLVRARGGVVALSSQGSVRHVPSYGALGAAKAALEATVRQLAVELGRRGVRINGIRAGLIESPVLSHFPALVKEEVKRRTPFGRLGTAAEIAAVVEFLLGPDARWIQGQVLEVDGGYAIA